jgi:hypothetical protein
MANVDNPRRALIASYIQFIIETKEISDLSINTIKDDTKGKYKGNGDNKHINALLNGNTELHRLFQMKKNQSKNQSNNQPNQPIQSNQPNQPIQSNQPINRKEIISNYIENIIETPDNSVLYTNEGKLKKNVSINTIKAATKVKYNENGDNETIGILLNVNTYLYSLFQTKKNDERADFILNRLTKKIWPHKLHKQPTDDTIKFDNLSDRDKFKLLEIIRGWVGKDFSNPAVVGDANFFEKIVYVMYYYPNIEGITLETPVYFSTSETHSPKKWYEIGLAKFDEQKITEQQFEQRLGALIDLKSKIREKNTRSPTNETLIAKRVEIKELIDYKYLNSDLDEFETKGNYKVQLEQLKKIDENLFNKEYDEMNVTILIHAIESSYKDFSRKYNFMKEKHANVFEFFRRNGITNEFLKENFVDSVKGINESDFMNQAQRFRIFVLRFQRLSYILCMNSSLLYDKFEIKDKDGEKGEKGKKIVKTLLDWYKYVYANLLQLYTDFEVNPSHTNGALNSEITKDMNFEKIERIYERCTLFFVFILGGEDYPLSTTKNKGANQGANNGSVAKRANNGSVAKRANNGSVAKRANNGSVAKRANNGSVAKRANQGANNGPVANRANNGSVANRVKNGSVATKILDGRPLHLSPTEAKTPYKSLPIPDKHNILWIIEGWIKCKSEFFYKFAYLMVYYPNIINISHPGYNYASLIEAYKVGFSKMSEQQKESFTKQLETLKAKKAKNGSGANQGGSSKEYIKLQKGGKRLIRYGGRGGRYYMKGGNKIYIK